MSHTQQPLFSLDALEDLSIALNWKLSIYGFTKRRDCLDKLETRKNFSHMKINNQAHIQPTKTLFQDRLCMILLSARTIVFEHGNLYTFAKGLSANLHLQRAFPSINIVTFSSSFNCFVCLIVAFVCSLRELRALRELFQVVLSFIYHVIWSKCCGPVI